MSKIAMAMKGSIMLNVELGSEIVMMNMRRRGRRRRLVVMVKLGHGHNSHHSSTHSMYTARCIHVPCPFPDQPDPHTADD